MIASGLNQFCRWVLFAAPVCSVVVALPAARAADNKIQFSDKAPRLSQPAPATRNNGLSRSIDSLNPNSSVAPAVGVPTSPFMVPDDPSRNQKLLDLYKKKKNWIFSDPKDPNSDSSLREGFQRKDTGGFGESQTGKGPIEQHLEREGKKSEADSVHREDRSLSDEKEDTDTTRQGASPFSASTTNKRAETTTRPEMSGFAVSGRLDSSVSPVVAGFPQTLLPQGGFMSGPLNLPDFDLATHTKDQQVRADHFRQLLNAPVGVPLPFGPGDPTGFNPDSTLQAVNPIVPVRPEDAARGLIQSGPLDPTRSLAMPSSVMPSSLRGDFSTKAFAPSSLAPALSSPLQIPRSQANPGTLPFPQRPF